MKHEEETWTHPSLRPICWRCVQLYGYKTLPEWVIDAPVKSRCFKCVVKYARYYTMIELRPVCEGCSTSFELVPENVIISMKSMTGVQ